MRSTMDETRRNSDPLPLRGDFDEDGYLQLHPDVAAAVRSGVVGSGWQHFTLHGFAEGRKWVARADPLQGVSREVSPADEMQRANLEHYFEVGASAVRCMEAVLFSARRERSSIRSILDLPCGHGRVLRFLRRAFPGAQLTACDLNRDGVEFCARVFGATPLFSDPDPDRIELSGTFDLIWCGSLLTHLPEEKAAAFLRLFDRALRPGGILVFTLHGRPCADEIATGRNRCGLGESAAADLLARYQRNGFGYVDYRDQPGYGISLAHPSRVTARLIARPDWRLIGYHEGAWDGRQDVIAIRKDG